MDKIDEIIDALARADQDGVPRSIDFYRDAASALAAEVRRLRPLGFQTFDEEARLVVNAKKRWDAFLRQLPPGRLP